MTMKLKLSFLFLLFSLFSMAQVGSLTINVFDEFSKKSIASTVKIQNFEQTFTGNGSVSITDLMSGNYNFEISSEGYDVGFLNDINVVPNQNLTFSIGLNKSAKQIQEVTLTKKLYKTTAESPVSLRNITAEEIQKNAGSNRDVSKAILSFPGVGSTATFRNDLFIRGGSSAENKFYIDGIEVPVITFKRKEQAVDQEELSP